jgi:hypothetical protein
VSAHGKNHTPELGRASVKKVQGNVKIPRRLSDQIVREPDKQDEIVQLERELLLHNIWPGCDEKIAVLIERNTESLIRVE